MKKCSVCGSDMNVVKKDAIEVDVCPQGHGMWLDSGELEKLLGDGNGQGIGDTLMGLMKNIPINDVGGALSGLAGRFFK